ncbi:RDD family protein [Acinetobacter sp. ANC5681]|uniref:RDD family protein n=1 Tax=Acinetobacter sp. ANC5681 TaxID=2929504 RepID=UPI00201AE2F0|nr:RDD family protein [Acinetobacter sp. ANC5681]MCL5766945.1 RDD family protein [Acinetobacter sp. ANC5681]
MSHTYEYAGFWLRFLASIIDSIILIVALIPIMMIIAPNAASGFTGWTWSDWLGQIIGAVFYIVCWVKFAGTPGKRLLRLKVLDEKTGENLTVGQAILRYIGYFPSTLVFFLGFIWIAFDSKKQGWHDKIAKSVVVREL